MTKREIDGRCIYGSSEHTLIGTIGNIKMCYYVDLWNNAIHWAIYEGDHRSSFERYDEARDYYLKITGGEDEF